MSEQVIDVPKLVEILDGIVSKFPEDHGAVCYYTNKGAAYEEWARSREIEVNDDGEQYFPPIESFKFEESIEPVCIAAQVVYELGGEDSLLKLEENTTIAILSNQDDYRTPQTDNNESVLESLGFTPEAKVALRRAQAAQDSGTPWATAVDQIRV